MRLPQWLQKTLMSKMGNDGVKSAVFAHAHVTRSVLTSTICNNKLHGFLGVRDSERKDTRTKQAVRAGTLLK